MFPSHARSPSPAPRGAVLNRRSRFAPAMTLCCFFDEVGVGPDLASGIRPALCVDREYTLNADKTPDAGTLPVHTPDGLYWPNGPLRYHNQFSFTRMESGAFVAFSRNVVVPTSHVGHAQATSAGNGSPYEGLTPGTGDFTVGCLIRTTQTPNLFQSGPAILGNIARNTGSDIGFAMDMWTRQRQVWIPDPPWGPFTETGATLTWENYQGTSFQVYWQASLNTRTVEGPAINDGRPHWLFGGRRDQRVFFVIDGREYGGDVQHTSTLDISTNWAFRLGRAPNGYGTNHLMDTTIGGVFFWNGRGLTAAECSLFAQSRDELLEGPRLYVMRPAAKAVICTRQLHVNPGARLERTGHLHVAWTDSFLHRRAALHTGWSARLAAHRPLHVLWWRRVQRRATLHVAWTRRLRTPRQLPVGWAGTALEFPFIWDVDAQIGATFHTFDFDWEILEEPALADFPFVFDVRELLPTFEFAWDVLPGELIDAFAEDIQVIVQVSSKQKI